MPGLSSALPRRRCRVFVSYAHEDALPHQPHGKSLLARFQLELKNLRRNLADEGKVLHEDEIFIDVERLRLAPAWRPAIERAVKECELLIFLVSPDSRGSDFCVHQELVPVASRQPPGLIVPVLLRETADWHKLDLGRAGRLGDCHSAGLPKNEKGNAMAITSTAWGDVDLAWRRMSEDLGHFMADKLFATAPKPAQQHSEVHDNGSHLPVTYFCDQLHATDQFEDLLHGTEPEHKPHALLAIVQGHYDDNPDMFVNRLHAHHLAARLQALGLSADPHRKPMAWRTHDTAAEPFEGKTAVRQLFEALGNGLPSKLARCRNMADASAELRHHLAQAKTNACVVFAQLPNRSARSVATLRALIQCIDGCQPVGHEMAKLTLFCIDEQPGARAAWAALLPTTHRLQAVALQALKPFDEGELRQWHVRYQLDPHWTWAECLAFFKETLNGASHPRSAKLRLREWVDAVRAHRPHIHLLSPDLPKPPDTPGAPP